MSSFTYSSDSDCGFSPSFTTNPKRKIYDVYLSFCEEDSRSFVLSIYTALISKPGVVFWDDQWFGSEDRSSKQPSDSALNVIEDCEIGVFKNWRK